MNSSKGFSSSLGFASNSGLSSKSGISQADLSLYFDGTVGQYFDVPVLPILGGYRIIFQFRVNNVSGDNLERRAFTGNSLFFRLRADNNNYDASDSTEVKIDSVVVPSQGVFYGVYDDGVWHTVEVTYNSTTKDLARIGQSTSGGANASWRGEIRNFSILDASGDPVRFYAINDGNNTIVDSVSGQNGTLNDGEWRGS